MVVRTALVDIIAHAGVENEVNTLFKQTFNVTVRQFCGIAYSVGRYGLLTLIVSRPCGLFREYHFKSQIGEKLCKERHKVVIRKAQRQPDFRDGLHAGLFLFQLFYVAVLIFDHIFGAVGYLYARAFFTSVARNKAMTVVEAYNSQIAVRTAAAALYCTAGVCKIIKFIFGDKPRSFQRTRRFLLSKQRTAQRTHQTGDSGTNDISAKLLLKRAQYSVIQESAALNNDISAQLVDGLGSYNFIDRILDYRSRKTRRNILDGSAVLLRLFYRTVHKNSASRAKLHRCFCEKSQLSEIGNIIAHSTRKGLYERAAARRTCFVQHNAVNGIIFYLETLYILSADVYDKINIGTEISRRLVMRDCLNYTVVNAQSRLDKFLTVACYSRSPYIQLFACESVNIFQF